MKTKPFSLHCTASAVLISMGSICAAASYSNDEPILDARELHEIHERLLTIDTHVDIPLNFASPELDPAGFTHDQVDLPKMRAGGLDAAFFIVFIPQGERNEGDLAAAREIAKTRLDAIRRLVAAYPGQIELAQTARDVKRINQSGRKIALIGMENAFPLGPNPTQKDIDVLARKGVRYVGLAHNGHNQFADSASPMLELGDKAEEWGGLSPEGEKLVGMLNKAGIMVDVSHASKKVTLEAARLSTAPIIASHSAVRALIDHPRNLDDEELLAIKATGGVAQIVAVDQFIKPYTDEQIAFKKQVQKEMGLETLGAQRAMSEETKVEYKKRLEGMWAIEPRGGVSEFVDHIDHAVAVAGVDHVGIASDFDGGGGIEGWDDASETPNVTRELIRRGYSSKDIAKLWGGNLLRVMSEVEDEAVRASR